MYRVDVVPLNDSDRVYQKKTGINLKDKTIHTYVCWLFDQN